MGREGFSWGLYRCLLRGARRRRLLLAALVFFWPAIIFLACLSCPLLCALALFARFGPALGNGDKRELTSSPDHGKPPPLGPQLLHQYLDDQLSLVAAAWDCCGDAH